jgi:hypothetical protein
MEKSQTARSQIIRKRAAHSCQILGYGIDRTGIDITLVRYLKPNIMLIVHFIILDLIRIVRTHGVTSTASLVSVGGRGSLGETGITFMVRVREK